MGAPRRFLSGVASVASDNPLGVLPYLDPTTWAVFFEDFLLIPDAGEDWTHTNTNGTLAVDSTNGCGSATLTMAGADNDLSQLYPAAGTFTLTSGKKAIFETKIRVDKATGTIGEEEIFVGLSSVQTGGNFTAADGLTMTVDDCIGFWSADGSAVINAIVRDTDVESITAAATIVDVTDIVLSWYYDGGSTIKFYVNDGLVAELNDVPADTALTPMLYIKAGEAKAKVLTCDYILVARER